MAKKKISFKSLGVCEALCESCKSLNWKVPTPIQQQAIPLAIQGRDIIGLAETGSGKTGAFAIPILQAILANPRRLAALILVPIREIAIQIGDQFNALGSHLGIEVAVIVGGISMEKQTNALYKKPHVIIATPGRLVDHLKNTRGFDDIIKAIRFLVIDEADRLLDMEFQEEVDKIVEIKPHDTITYLYSATMTEKVEKLERAALLNPAKIEVCEKFQTVETLKQFMTFSGNDKNKDCYLVHILNQHLSLSSIVFCATIENTKRIGVMLSYIGFQVGSIHGKMTLPSRLDAIKRFKEKKIFVLVATDVAGRGLDIPNIDLVINFDIPSPKHYIHRIGRTARAGREGTAITIVSASDVQSYLLIEAVALKQKLPKYEVKHKEAMFFKQRVENALARMEEDEENASEGGGVKRSLAEPQQDSAPKRKRKITAKKKLKIKKKQKLKKKMKN